jgi:hypothetical protein
MIAFVMNDVFDKFPIDPKSEQLAVHVRVGQAVSPAGGGRQANY